MIGYTTKAQRDADIARLEAELAKAKAAPVEADISEAADAFFRSYYGTNDFPKHTHADAGRALTAAYPALHRALGAPDEWREAVEHELTVNHLGTADSFASPRDAVRALIECEQAMALDPAVSERAKALASPAVPWPGAKDLQDMIIASSNDEYEEAACSRFARRIREYQQANAAPEPTPAEDLAMAREIAAGYYDQIQPGLASRMRQGHADDQPSVVSSLAAIQAERRRAQGGAS